MTTSTNDGTSNAERIASEVNSAAENVPERFPGYRERLAAAALECYRLTAEHGEQRISINQKYDEAINRIANSIGRYRSEGNEP